MSVHPGAGERLNTLLHRRRLTMRALEAKTGVSRQTLSAVLNQDRLTERVAARIAPALGVSAAYLLGESPEEEGELAAGGQWEPEPEPQPADAAPSEAELEEFISNMDHIVRTLRTLPGGRLGVPLRIAVLNGIEQAAAQAGAVLPPRFFDIRRRVLAGEDL